MVQIATPYEKLTQRINSYVWKAGLGESVLEKVQIFIQETHSSLQLESQLGDERFSIVAKNKEELFRFIEAKITLN